MDLLVLVQGLVVGERSLAGATREEVAALRLVDLDAVGAKRSVAALAHATILWRVVRIKDGDVAARARSHRRSTSLHVEAVGFVEFLDLDSITLL